MEHDGWGDKGRPEALFEDDEDDDSEEDSQHESTVETSTDTDGGVMDVDSTTEKEPDRDRDPVSSPIPLDELDVDRNYSPRMLARSMTPMEYRDDPAGSRVPFAVWRNGVGYGRDRKTFEIQSDIEAVERDVLDAMDKQLGGRPPLTDLREIALVYGLLHWEDLAEMADELGVQYDG